MQHPLTQLFAYQSLSAIEMTQLVPTLILAVTAVLGLIFASSKNPSVVAFTAFFSLAGLAVAMIVQATGLYAEPLSMLDGVLVYNTMTRGLSLIIMAIGLMSLLLILGQRLREHILPEIYPLAIFAITAMTFLALTSHLLFIFIALEIMSLAVYIMVGIKRNTKFGAEAAMKYFILGGIAGALYLYGVALVFGATGTFSLVKLSEMLQQSQVASVPLLSAGAGLILVALLFKVGAFPMHFWVPDVYQGATTSVTAFMSNAVKFTAFIPFYKIAQMLLFRLPENAAQFFYVALWIVAAVTILYANLAAYGQHEMKRLLAYSSIAHSGYLITGILIAKNVNSAAAVFMYLIFYCVSGLGALAVLISLSQDNTKDIAINDLAGLSTRHPYWAGALAVFFLAMAGIPSTAGFIGKYYLFNQVVSTGETMLIVIAILGSLLSVYYYLRVIVTMYMQDKAGTAVARFSPGAAIVTILMLILTVHFGLFPSALIEFLKSVV